MLRVRRLLLLSLLAAAAMPASASAAVTVGSAKITPSTTAAGGHPDVTVDLSFGESPASDDLKSLTSVLPQGLVGDPRAADRCSEASFRADSCPASSRVGTTTVTAQVTIVATEVPQDSSGDVYNLVPHAGEPARLGGVVRPQAPAPKMFLESPVTIGPQTSYGLATTFDDLSRTAGALQIRITRMVLKLNGHATHGAFLTNPTGCGAATASFTATSYDDAAHPSSATASFTPTNCAALPFAPTLSGTIGGRGNTAKGASPELVTTIARPAGNANIASSVVALPGAVTANIAHPTCAEDVLAAGNCPVEARVGSARSTSSLLSSPLAGPVWLVTPTGGGLPELVVQLRGAIDADFVGTPGVASGHLANTFSGLPDLPIGTFELTIAGGHGGLLTNVADLCAPGSDVTAPTSFTAHSGATRSLSVPLAVKGCPPPLPSGWLELRFHHGRGTLTGHFAAAHHAPRLARVRVTLPDSLSHTRHHPAELVTAYADRHRLGKRAVRIRGRRLEIVVPNGARGIAFRWRRLKGPARSRPSFAVEVVDFAKRDTRLTLKSR